MITFFRKIRRWLIAENKFTKYLLYAAGEIVLVVIGILIALSINNWNEERKKDNTVATYKKSLIEDLKNVVAKSESAISEMEDELKVLSAISERINHNSMNMDSFVNIYRFEFNPNMETYEISTVTIDALVSSGDINILEKDLYNRLMVLKGVQEKTIQSIELNKNFYTIYSSRINLPFIDSWNAFGGEALDRIWDDIDKKGFLRDFNAALSSKVVANKFIIKAQNELLIETESVLRELTDQD